MKDDRTFFDDFVRKHTARALAFCRGKLGSRDAEDVVQDVMLRLYARVEQLRELPDPLPYLYRALQNAVIDRARSAKGVAGLEQDVADERGFDEPEPDGDKAQAALLQALERLPKEQSDMLKLRYFDDLSVVQVAEVFGIAPAAAAMRLARARAKLKSELARIGVRSGEDLE